MIPRHPTVLVVDDHADTCEMLKIFFRSRGLKTIGAHNIETARAGFRMRPSVVILDLSLPQLEDSCRLATEFSSVAGTFVIGLNGFGFDHCAIKALDAGCSVVLPKPFDLDALLVAVVLGLRSKNPAA